MTYIRRNVYGGDDWAEPILWYARGVRAMQARPLADVRSWKFFAGIHGYLDWLWEFYGVKGPDDAEPSEQDRRTYFDQCQHQSWFFLPWHRGYLLALERQIRREIELLGGPHETWALPYWNYLEDGRGAIPPAFRTRSWPDGANDNPLFIEQRWGDMALAPVQMLQGDVHANPMADREFSGPGNGGSTGFGGRPTGFNWNGGDNGGCEWQPHNTVHGFVGGQHPDELTLPPPNDAFIVPGLMSLPQTAALDPIFYLHHSNIDRLWESWNFFPADKRARAINFNDWENPSGSDWREGPAASGDREFAMPNPDGSRWVFTPSEMAGWNDNLRRDDGVSALGYTYDDLTPGAAVDPDILATRVARLGLSQPEPMIAGAAMNSSKTVEMMGAGSGRVALVGTAPRRSVVRLDQLAVARLTSSLSQGAPASGLPDRVFLNLENVRSQSDVVLFRVYVGLPPGADPAQNQDHLAGAVSLFGSTLASDTAGKHGGNGITHVIEVTEILDRLHLSGELSAAEIAVDLVPVHDVPESAQVEIGNISIYRQSA